MIDYKEHVKKFNRDYFDNPEFSNWDHGYTYFYVIGILRELHHYIHSVFPDVEKVVCLGCARGYECHIWNADFKVFPVGVEVSWYAISTTEMPYLKGILINGDICSMPLRSNSFDLAIASEVFEHIPEPYVDRAISETSRISPRLFATICMYKGRDDRTRDRDRTHVTIKPKDWWINRFKRYYSYVEYRYYHIWNCIIALREYV